ncbi:hypothetical protein [Pseudomonas sp. LB3P14]
MLHIDHVHLVVPIEPGKSPNYNQKNPLTKLLSALEGSETSAGLQHYLVGSRNYLFPFRDLSLYGPSGEDWQVGDPRLQDNKTDFQKQNVAGFDLTETQLVRGYASAGDWTGPFLHISYVPAKTSVLALDGGPYLEDSVTLYLKVGDANTGTAPISVPYNSVTHRYEVELWAYDKADLRTLLDKKGRAAMDRGELIARPDLVKGNYEDFEGTTFDALRDKLKAEGRGLEMFEYKVEHSMHPIRTLRIELAWGNKVGDRWDSQGGENYRYEFAMTLRGRRNYIEIGESEHPHGGLGSLEYRNLFSNYSGYEERRRQELGDGWMSELGRDLYEWNSDAYGRKPPPESRELFMPVNYWDVHDLRPNSAIGLHRHRDNLEAFQLIASNEGEHAYMITGDWCKRGERERAFEIRTMFHLDIALIRGGQLHSLVNDGDTTITLCTIGGYD